MAVGVATIKKPGESGSGGILDLIGKGLGAAIGFVGSGFNPAGAVAGAGVGGNIGGAIGNAIDPGSAPSESANTGVPQGAIARKLASSGEDNLTALRQSAMALPQIPEELRAEYAPPILQAYQMEINKRKQGV